MLDRIETFISGELESRKIPGAAIAVVRPRQPVWSQGFGTANVETGEPMTARTPFSIQSITKTFVGTAIMQLHDRGRLSVDDPVAKYLPAVVQNEWEAENPVLVSHLLTHTSGLPVDTAGGPPGGPRSLEEYVRLVARTVRPPGGEIIYANWGYAVAGLLIEKLSGDTWYGYITKHICEPLGMRSTSVPPRDDAAYGHYLSAVDGELHRMGRAQWPVEPSDPAGGLVSTIEDLTLFASAHVDARVPLVCAATLGRMHGVSACQADVRGMALGFRSTWSNDSELLCHGGDGSGFTNFLGFYREEGVAVVLTLNRGGVQAARSVIANTVAAMCLDRAPRRRTASAVETAPLADGLYTSSFWNIELAIETADETLTARPVAGLVISDGPQPSTLSPTGDGTFIAEGGMLHGFEIALGDDGSLYGGLYPYSFTRVGDIPDAVEEPVDEAEDLIGSWTGSITTPLGALALGLDVWDSAHATIDTPFGQAVPLEECEARAGRLSGRFSLTVPTAGEMIMFPRLEVRAGKLSGPIYARGWFGELPMPAELEKG